jgi:hypothetical protein
MISFAFYAVITLFSLSLHFLPSIIAFKRGHSDFTMIVLINLFLSWTVIGWIVALVWSLSRSDAIIPLNNQNRPKSADRL